MLFPLLKEQKKSDSPTTTDANIKPTYNSSPSKYETQQTNGSQTIKYGTHGGDFACNIVPRALIASNYQVSPLDVLRLIYR